MKRTFRLVSPLILALLAGSSAHAKDLPSYDVSFEAKTAVSPAASIASIAPAGVPSRGASPLSAFVASRDPRTGAPSFVWGSRKAQASLSQPKGQPQAQAPALTLSATTPPEDAARAHLAAHAELYGLSKVALDTARVVHVHDTGRGGIIVVLRQEIDGVPLFAHDAKVLLRRDRSLVALTGGLHPLAIQSAKVARTFALPHAGAVARALSDLHALSVPSSALVPQALPGALKKAAGADAAPRLFDLKPAGQGGLAGLRLERPARARKVYFTAEGSLIPAYYVEVFSVEEGAETDVYGYVVSAEDGRVLRRTNLTAHAAFKYRVFADETGDKRPLDGPIADFTPHPTGVPDGSYPAFVAPVLVEIDGFNGPGDPWLDDGATQSRGNNVDAYTDHDDSNNVSGGDVRATTTAPGELDHVYDTSQDPLASEEQMMAAVTQLFYTTNWLHDYWYDSGFDEAAGNAQTDNYGRGGQANDPLRCEAQDAYDDGASDNANMATPEDGSSPRMQMYVWSGKETSRILEIEPTGQTPNTNVATFGPKSFDVTAEAALVDDATETTTDGCQAIVNDVAGKIAVVDRGNCFFSEKAVSAQAAGAIGMILVNNQAGQPPYMPGDPTGIDIPVLSISQGQGNTLKAALAAGAVTAHMQREATAEADGTIDNLIVAHEWGHYLHHRLVSCGLNHCGAESEGWGDFIALTLQLRESDNLDGVFSDALYATGAFDNAAYFGTRRVPYSVDPTKNSLTFKHIEFGVDLPTDVAMVEGPANNAEVHNAGEVWASMLFEGYVAMLKKSKEATPKYTFDEARRRFADYVVAGMKLAPVEPTMTEQRDAIVAAAFAADPDDGLLIAEGFARRGAGSCAESPDRASFDNAGVVESFVVAPAVQIADVALDDSKDSCDGDGLLDAGETGKVTVTIANRGFLPAPGTTVKVSSTTPGVTFPDGAEATIEALDGFSEAVLEMDVTIDPKQKVPGVIDLSVIAENAAACNPSLLTKRAPRVNYDNSAQASAADDFESDLSVWTVEGLNGDEIWSEITDETGNHLWHGVDYSSLSDTRLVSPPLVVSDTESFVMSFVHRHKFETSNENPDDPESPLVLWDGSVIEVRVDGGPWEDISTYGDPGYGGQIGNLAENPLADREGYTNQNPSWPGTDAVTIDMGTALAGKTVEIRFRIGSDQAASEIGWQIDDVAFQGITGTPFPVVTNDAQTCSPVVDHAPVASAGADQSVKPGEAVTLDASASFDEDGDELSFGWSQVAGDAVELTADGAKVTFVAPDVDEEISLTFAVKVTANGLSSDDTVTVLVKPTEKVTDELEISGSGCGCAVPGDEKAPAAPLGALGALLAGLLAYRRRRSL